MWFTNYSGPPASWSPREGYSELFKTTVRLIREQFTLEKSRAGLDINPSGAWVNYTLQDREVRVKVSRFSYDDVEFIGNHISPVFRLSVEMQMQGGRRRRSRSQVSFSRGTEEAPMLLRFLYDLFPEWEWVARRMRRYQRSRYDVIEEPPEFDTPTSGDDWQNFFSDTIVIVFPESFPAKPPRFRVDNAMYRAIGVSHTHHTFEEGWMCILADRHDWKAYQDSIISGLNAAFDWVVLHYLNHGW